MRTSDHVLVYKTRKNFERAQPMLIGRTSIRTAAHIYYLNASEVVEHLSTQDAPFWWQDANYRYELRPAQ